VDARQARSAAWSVLFSGIAAILAMVTLRLFISLGDPAFTSNARQSAEFWGSLSDICLVFQMAFLLAVATDQSTS
jgi:hypothetical protein